MIQPVLAWWRGLAATEALHGGKGVVRDAMFRLGAGSITFYFGEAGNAAKRYRGGSGLAHPPGSVPPSLPNRAGPPRCRVTP
ncbi:hypothetical protein AAFN88_12705 [Pelagibius sp. CAU 1746]|uniref:hypothetical protein n=1 Tax=Pelagibius sp. CAU 1746 TaxID=3140370 RepID=UPI00325B57BD